MHKRLSTWENSCKQKNSRQPASVLSGYLLKAEDECFVLSCYENNIKQESAWIIEEAMKKILKSSFQHIDFFSSICQNEERKTHKKAHEQTCHWQWHRPLRANKVLFLEKFADQQLRIPCTAISCWFDYPRYIRWEYSTHLYGH